MDDSGTFESSETAQQFMNPGKTEAVKIVLRAPVGKLVEIDHFAAWSRRGLAELNRVGTTCVPLNRQCSLSEFRL
jgi:hypothetical protein